jgi:hypothetical protein
LASNNLEKNEPLAYERKAQGLQNTIVVLRKIMIPLVPVKQSTIMWKTDRRNTVDNTEYTTSDIIEDAFEDEMDTEMDDQDDGSRTQGGPNVNSTNSTSLPRNNPNSSYTHSSRVIASPSAHSRAVPHRS